MAVPVSRPKRGAATVAGSSSPGVVRAGVHREPVKGNADSPAGTPTGKAALPLTVGELFWERYPDLAASTVREGFVGHVPTESWDRNPVVGPDYLGGLEALFTQHLGWGPVDLPAVGGVFAAYLSSHLPGGLEPAWPDLIAPPSHGKGELLAPFMSFPMSVNLDHLTANAFASSYQDDKNKTLDFSLINRLSWTYWDREQHVPVGNKTGIIPEFSTKEKGDAGSTAQFRRSFDGSFGVASGNKGYREYKCLSFGLITAGTELIDQYKLTHANLGERTITCRLGKGMVDPKVGWDGARRTFGQSQFDKQQMRKTIETFVHTALYDMILYVQQLKAFPSFSEDLNQRISSLAAFGCRARATAMTDPLCTGGGGPLSRNAEAPHRLTLQLKAWLMSRCLLAGRIALDETDYSAARTMVQDSIPPDNLDMLHNVWRGSADQAVRPISTEAVADGVHATRGYVDRQISQWVRHHTLLRHGPGLWGIHPFIADQLDKTRFFDGVLRDGK